MQKRAIFAFIIGLFLSLSVFADTSNPTGGGSGGSGSGSGGLFGTGNNSTSTTNTTDSSASAQTAPGVTLSSSAKDQTDLTKLFDHSKYEDFAKQKPVGGFSLSSPASSEEMP